MADVAPAVDVHVPQEEATGEELRDFFGEDVSLHMAELWRRINDGDYETQDEKKFIMFELLQYENLVHRRLKERQYDKWALWACVCCPCFLGDEDDNKDQVEVELPYGEVKRQSEACRGLLLQIVLELLSLVSDILFLFVLFVVDLQLFYFSLGFLVVALLGRMYSVCRGIRAEAGSGFGYIVCAFLVNSIETNAGLSLQKMALQKTFNAGRDPVAEASLNDYHAGWSELRNIMAVTIIEDLPQLAIQLTFLARQGDEINSFFVFAITTTVAHILFQWFEAVITFSFVKKWLCGWRVPSRLKLLDIVHGRDVTTTKDSVLLRDLKAKDLFRNAVGIILLPIILPFLCILCCIGSVWQTELSCLDGCLDPPSVIPEEKPGEFVAIYGNHMRRIKRQDDVQNFPIISFLLESTQGQWITHLNLADMDIDEASLNKFHFRFLLHLNLEATNITDKGLLMMLHHCRSVVNLNLANTQIENAGIEAIIEYCPRLTNVNLWNTNASAATLLRLCKECKRLEHVNLANTEIDDLGVGALGGNGILRHLNLWNCHSVTEQARASLVQCVKLKSLDLRGTLISRDTRRQITNTMPSLEVLDGSLL